MNVEKRQEIERKVVRRLIRAMKEKGWNVLYVNDGEEQVKCRTEQEAIDTVFSVDESWIYFSKPVSDSRKFKRMAYIVLGNDGYDCIADHSCSVEDESEDDFQSIMDQVQEYADKFCE